MHLGSSNKEAFCLTCTHCNLYSEVPLPLGISDRLGAYLLLGRCFYLVVCFASFGQLGVLFCYIYIEILAVF